MRNDRKFVFTANAFARLIETQADLRNADTTASTNAPTQIERVTVLSAVQG